MVSQAKSPEESSRLRVAYVDDEPVQLAALQRIIASESLEVVTFANAPEALAQILGGEFAVVISDNNMPGLSGMEMLAKIKETGSPCRRILLTGGTDLNDAIDAFNAGIIHGFLAKPWKRAQVMELLNKELETYKASKSSEEERIRLAEISKNRGTRLIQTLGELKTARTELTLLEDMTRLDDLRASTKLHGLSILVVEENPKVRTMIVDSLKNVGLPKTVGAESASAALELAGQARPFDIVLSEWTMHDMDGLKLLRELRHSERPSAKALFMLMAGVEQKSLIEMALKAGVDAYLIKPFRIATLLSHLERMVGIGQAANLQAIASIKNLKCLVVNSQPSSREQIEQMLAMVGIAEVHGATFGSAALKLLREKRPDIVIYDVNVDNPNWQAIRETIAQAPWGPALLLTGVFATDEDWQRIRDASISHFLPGPFRQKDLVESIVAVRGKAGGNP